MTSAVHGDGTPWARAADVDGVALARGRRAHQRTYRVIVESDRARLMVLGCEAGGRWDSEALDALSSLAAHKAREAPELLRRSATVAWGRRWLSLLSVAAQTAVAETLQSPGSPHLSELDGAEPPLGDLLALGCEQPAPDASAPPSRLPR